MAWFSDLAGKAEDMLNKLDQNAATVLVSTPLREVKCDPEVKSKDIPVAGPSPPPPAPNLDQYVVSVIEQEIADGNNQRMSAEEELAATKIILSAIRTERDELKAEVSTLVDQIHARGSGRHRIVELEKELVELKETNRELMESNRELSDSVYLHGKTVSELQLSCAQLKQSLGELQEQLTFARQEAERAVTELANYRTRAQTTLQLKERMIEELRGQGDTNTIKASSETETLSNLEIEQLRGECKDNLAEIAAMKMKMEGYQEHIIKLEQRLATSGEESAENLKKLRLDYERVEKERKAMHQEVTLLQAEIHAIRTQSNKSNQTLMQQIHEKDMEIASLRKRSTTIEETGGNLDNRIRTMTQSLIQKQTTLEEVSAERNSLRIQLEKIEGQYKQLMGQYQQLKIISESAHPVQYMTDDDKAQLPLFVQENPFDNRLAKRMKLVIRASDSLGAQLGSFLRRYPLLRILFLVYTALLHVWVMFVLMSSSPNS